MQRAQTERTNRKSPEPLRGEAIVQRDRDGTPGGLPDGHEHADGLPAEAPERHLKNSGGRRVQPMQVVDRHDDRTSLGQDAHDIEHSQPDGVRIRD